MAAQTFTEAFTRVKQLAAIFKGNESFYLGAGYNEADARKDFIDKFWMALGWDVNHETQTDPYKQEVKVERGVATSEMRKRADYAFLAPNFRDIRFYVEAKKPHVGIDNPLYYFQTIRYGWSSHTPVAVLTDFEELRVLDCRFKPNINTVLGHAVLKYHYDDYCDEAKFRTIYYLFSREAVLAGSIESFAQGLPKLSRKRTQRGAVRDEHQDIDESFLRELDEYRAELASSFKRKNPELDGPALTEVTQRTLDRLVFMRFLEDKLIESEPLIEDLNRRGAAWQNFISTSRRLDRIYNGIIFKEHALLDNAAFKVDDKTFEKISSNLAHANSPYDFNAIPIHILGSIYERFLGKVIVATGKRARVEEKPEVRKAGGVYYTPEYIVRYIVDNTVGKLIEGKTPEEIRPMRFADIACGSGSFLLGIYDTLLRYHTAYYNRNKRTQAEGRKAGCIEIETGALRLSLLQKRTILLNNVHGVDIDPQAVEVAQLSLYLKLLEDETIASTHQQQLEMRAALLPSLAQNIICGNSLIGRDISEGKLFETADERKLNPMNFEDAFPEVMKRGGFDAIVGNPPYIRIQTLQETAPLSVEYFKQHFVAASRGNYDIYVVFVEHALSLLNQQGKMGYILPHKFFNAKYGEPLRGLISKNKQLAQVIHFGDQQVFSGAATYTCLMFLDKSPRTNLDFTSVNDIKAWRESGVGEHLNITADQVSADEWNFSGGIARPLFERLRTKEPSLGEIAHLFVGLQTDADDVFILEEIRKQGKRVLCKSKATGREHWFEDSHLKQFLKGSLNIRRYLLADVSKRLIFPYELKEGRSLLIDAKDYEQRFPLTWSYLASTRERLSARNKGRMGREWHGYVYKKNHTRFGGLKLVVPSIAMGSSFAADLEGTYYFVGSGGGGGGGYGIRIESDDRSSYLYLLGLLNSRLLNLFLKSISTPFRGGYIALNRQYIEKLPIHLIDSTPIDRVRETHMVQLVEQMLDAKKQLAGASTDRDKTFYESKCASLDRQIDQLVYELYELTPEEIAIVEGASR
jgi:type I restriction-modification system DNA methylase subunit